MPLRKQSSLSSSSSESAVPTKGTASQAISLAHGLRKKIMPVTRLFGDLSFRRRWMMRHKRADMVRAVTPRRA